MSNGNCLAKSIAREEGISLEEAKEICKERKKKKFISYKDFRKVKGGTR